jgi:RNA polymerase sigma-70 factor (ECF subfamily)
VAQPEKLTEEIVRELKRGQNRKEDFRLLYHRYSGPILRFFEKKGVTDGEELKDDVFLVVYNNLEGLREEARFEYWLFTIAKNRYKNWLKQQGARRRLEVSLTGDEDEAKELDRPAPLTANPEHTLLAREKLEQVWEALQALPDQKRLVVILAWVEERSPKEIASTLAITINTVYAHLHQAQKILKEKLGRDFDDL